MGRAEQVERTRNRGGTWESADTIAVVKMDEVKFDAQMVLSVLAVLYILWMLRCDATSFRPITTSSLSPTVGAGVGLLSRVGPLPAQGAWSTSP